MFYYILKYHWVFWVILLLMFFPPTKDDLWFVLCVIGFEVILFIAHQMDVKRQKRIAARKKDEVKIITPDRTEVEDKPEEHGVVDSDRPYSIADEIEKYANLRDRGVITEEEFAQQKRKLLELDPLGRK